MRQFAKPGVALKLIGITMIVGGGASYAALGDPDENPAANAGALVGFAGIIVHFRGRQLAARAAAIEPSIPTSVDGPQVLYLRSFATDPSSMVKILESGLSTEEEQLATVLRPFGELVAIGEPGETLPLPGAKRVYATDSEWKNVVLDRMRTSSLVVIRAGVGAGLMWEVAQAFRNVQPEKLLVLVFRTPASDYSTLAAKLQTDLGVVLPAITRVSRISAVIDYRDKPSTLHPGFIQFDKGWTARFLPMPRPWLRLGFNDFLMSFNDALRPVFETRGIKWQPLRRFGGRKKES